MKGYINGFDWVNAEAMKYWSFPSSYQKDKKAEIKNYIYSGEYLGALKVDGYYQRVIKDDEGNIFMVARNKSVSGEAIDKHEWVPQLKDFFEWLPNGTCLFCEIYLPLKESSKSVTSILGCLKDKAIDRQKEEKNKLHLYIFDIAAWKGDNLIDHNAFYRFELLQSINFYKNDYVHIAKYYTGNELWNKLQEYLADGKEGMVITHESCPIYFKRTPARKTIKIKKEIQETIDVIITGINAPTKLYGGKEIETWKYWINLKDENRLPEGEHYSELEKGAAIEAVSKNYYYNWAGSFRIGLYNKEGKVEYFGDLSGLTDEMKSNWKDYIGKVAAVGGMEIFKDEDHVAIRHPKLIEFRNDKTPKECTYEQII